MRFFDVNYLILEGKNKFRKQKIDNRLIPPGFIYSTDNSTGRQRQRLYLLTPIKLGGREFLKCHSFAFMTVLKEGNGERIIWDEKFDEN